MRSPLVGVELEVAGDLAELGDAHLAEVGDLEVVPLAGGLELLLLFVFGDGGAAATDGGASSGSAVALSADRAGRGRVRAYGKGHLRVMGGPGDGARGIAAAARVPVGMSRA